MGLTVTKTTAQQGSSLRGLIARDTQIYSCSVAFDSSYPTGGEAIIFPFTPDIVIITPASGYIFEYDYTNAKILVYYFDYDAVADGAAIQVPNTTDLSALTSVRMIAIKI